jgi:poly-gamma-glutamate biosynthesis protein PgsC/CapC
LSSDVIATSLGLGLIISLTCFVVTRVNPGGIISPGWIAFLVFNDRPRILLVIASAVIAFAATRLVSRWMILYGKRMFGALLLVSVLAQWLLTRVAAGAQVQETGLYTLGFIVPGLIAYQIDQQGALPTVSSLILVSGMVYAVFMAATVLGA